MRMSLIDWQLKTVGASQFKLANDANSDTMLRHNAQAGCANKGKKC